jgi:hypothetical protein
MDFETIDHYTPGCIQHTLYSSQENIRTTPPATRPDPNTLLKSRKMDILGGIRGRVAQEATGRADYSAPPPGPQI